MRNYEGIITLPPTNDYRKGISNTRRKVFGRRKNLKIVHIGEDVWRIGKASQIDGKGLHCVIYGPSDKEYHIWNDDVRSMSGEYWNEWGEIGSSFDDEELTNRNHFQLDKVKIYILTSILDDKNNWCFNLTNIPEKGKLKVIYDNGTIKNIDFNGVFETIEIDKYSRYNGIKNEKPYSKKKIKPIGYRK